MGALSIVLLVLGILMLIEGSFALFFTKSAKKASRLFIRLIKVVENHLRAWGTVEIIIAIILIIISQKV